MLLAQAAPLARSDITFEALLIEPWKNLLTGHPAEAIVLLIPVGLAFLVWGFRLYRWLVILAFAAIGGLLGLALATYLQFSGLVGLVAGALVMGVLAWPLHRFGWAVLGGMAFSLVASEAARLGGVVGPVALFIIGAIAFIVGVTLTLWLLRPLIIVVTSILGGGLLAEAALRLADAWPTMGEPVHEALAARPWLPLAFALGLAAVGAVLQLSDSSHARRKKKRAVEEEE
jgi:hypothetical protein